MFAYSLAGVGDKDRRVSRFIRAAVKFSDEKNLRAQNKTGRGLVLEPGGTCLARGWSS
jgi:hypothetical protein